MIALVYKGPNLVSYGFNREKTHPLMRRVKQRYGVEKMYEGSRSNWTSDSLHAEVDALKEANKGDTLVVLRESPGGRLLCAKPCLICQKYIEECGIKNVYYSEDNQIKKMN